MSAFRQQFLKHPVAKMYQLFCHRNVTWIGYECWSSTPMFCLWVTEIQILFTNHFFFFSHCRQIWLNLSCEDPHGWLLFLLDKSIRCSLMVAMSGILCITLKFSLDYTFQDPAWTCVRLALCHLGSHQVE